MVKNASVFRGRFQGVTKAHKAIAELIRKNSPNNKIIILIVNGKKTSLDKQFNPFIPQVRQKMWKRIMPDAQVVHTDNVFTFLKDFQDSQYNIEQFYIGSDRFQKFNDIAKYFPNITVMQYPQQRQDMPIDINTLRATDIKITQMSSTMMREALKHGLQNVFRKVAPQQIHGMWKQLRELFEQRQLMKQSVQLKQMLKQNTQVIEHLQHIEDSIINNGKKGLQDFISRVNMTISSREKKTGKISQKIDGRPRLFFGIDPRNGQFFISTKSIVSNSPKLNHSVEQIQQNHSDKPQLANKLTKAFQYLKDLVTYTSNKVYHGDLLFTEDTLQQNMVDDELCLTFTPNVITYAVPVDDQSQLYNDIKDAKVGAVIHTQYNVFPKGNKIVLRKFKSDFTRLINAAKVNTQVFLRDPFHPAADISIDKNGAQQIQKLISRARMRISNISDQFNSWWVSGKTMPMMKMYLNKQLKGQNGGIYGAVRTGRKFDFQRLTAGFKKFIQDRFQQQSSLLKTSQSQQKKKARMKLMLKTWDQQQQNTQFLMTAYYDALQIKQILLKMFNRIRSKVGKTFVVKGDGLQVARPQGFVLLTDNGVVKLIDRIQFSRNNFLYGRFRRMTQGVGNFQQLILQKIKNKLNFYCHFNNKVDTIMIQSKRLIQSGSAKGIKLLQGLRIKAGKQYSYMKILQGYNKQKAIKLWSKLDQVYVKNRQNITQIVRLAKVQIGAVKHMPIGVNALLSKNWITKNQNVKPIFDKLNYFNKKFIDYIQGIFMSQNFALNWQKAKYILRKAAMQMSMQKQPTTRQNILNQFYDKINDQGQLDSPSERMTKLKDATKAYAQQVHVLSSKVAQMHNQESSIVPGQKKLNDQQYQNIRRAVNFTRQNLDKIAKRYQQLMVLTSPANKGKFYINLMLLFWGNRKIQDIQMILNEVDNYNREVDGFGFQKLEKM